MGLERAMKKTKQDLVQASRHFAAGIAELETVRNTQKLGQPLPSAFEKGLDQSAAPGGLVRVYNVRPIHLHRSILFELILD